MRNFFLGSVAETISEKEQGSLSPEPPTVSEDWHLPPTPQGAEQESRRAGEVNKVKILPEISIYPRLSKILNYGEGLFLLGFT